MDFFIDVYSDFFIKFNDITHSTNNLLCAYCQGHFVERTQIWTLLYKIDTIIFPFISHEKFHKIYF